MIPPSVLYMLEIVNAAPIFVSSTCWLDLSPFAMSQRSAHVPQSLQSPYAPLESPPAKERPLHVVLAATGSVASVKVPLMVERLLQYENVRVQVIASKSALSFFNGEAINQQPENANYSITELADEVKRGRDFFFPAHVWTDEDEWSSWKRVGDPILHIELRRWADIVLVAPCSANTLAKLNAGICDNLVTSFMRALSPSTPTLLFPAMNTLMYMHPLTATHLRFVQDQLGYEIHGPIEKRLACGDLGTGAMYEWTDIVQLIVSRYKLQQSDSISQ